MAKIKEIRCIRTRATGTWIIVKVITDQPGLYGIGSAHDYNATGAVVAAIEQWMAPRLIGRDASRIEDIWQSTFTSGYWRSGPTLNAALAGIDIALWDIKGKHAGLPVWRLLGGEKRPIPTYATGGYYRPGAPDTVYAEELAGFVKAGYRAVKLKTGAGSPEDEARRVRTVREAIGKDIALMLDMNAPYDVDGCIEFARRVEPLDIYWLEEPLHWYLQPTDFKRLAEATSIPLAHGERELTRFTVRDFIASGAVRYVQFDSTRAAGFTESVRIAQLAEQFGALIAPHQVPELHAHLCAAFPGASFGVEINGNPRRNPVWEGMYRKRATIEKSYVQLNDEPGFGVEIDWDFVARHKA